MSNLEGRAFSRATSAPWHHTQRLLEPLRFSIAKTFACLKQNAGPPRCYRGVHCCSLPWGTMGGGARSAVICLSRKLLGKLHLICNCSIPPTHGCGPGVQKQPTLERGTWPLNQKRNGYTVLTWWYFSKSDGACEDQLCIQRSLRAKHVCSRTRSRWVCNICIYYVEFSKIQSTKWSHWHCPHERTSTRLGPRPTHLCRTYTPHRHPHTLTLSHTLAHPQAHAPTH